MKKFLPLLLCLFLSGCSNTKDPEVHAAGNVSAENASEFLMSHLPVQIDSTEYLIHPIGVFSIRGGEKSGYFGSSDSQSNGFFGNNDMFYGELTNLKFQKTDSDSLKLLTEKNLKITKFNFLRDIFNNTRKKFFVFEVIELDWNSNGRLDAEDPGVLYISRESGENFRNLTPKGQVLLDWKTIPQQNRLYFRSIEDTNMNGKFEKEDRVHYFYIDFDAEALDVKEYNPV